MEVRTSGEQLGTGLYPWYQNLCGALIFLHAGLNFRKKNEKTQISAQNLTSLVQPSPP